MRDPIPVTGVAARARDQHERRSRHHPWVTRSRWTPTSPPAVWSYHRDRSLNRAREGRSMMKRFFIGMLILGGIIAAAAVVMKRRSGSDVSWDEFARDTSARMSDAAAGGSETVTDAADRAKEVTTDAAAEAKKSAGRASDKAQDLAEKAAETVVNLTEEAKRSTSEGIGPTLKGERWFPDHFVALAPEFLLQVRADGSNGTTA